LTTRLRCESLGGAKTGSEDQRRGLPWRKRFVEEERLFGLARQTLEERKAIGLFCGGSTKYLQAQLSIAYAAGEMPFENRHFMSNGCLNVECRFEIFLRWIGHQWCENLLV